MPSISKRALIKFGRNNLAITLPKSWTDYYKLEAKEKVEVKATGHILIKRIKKQ